MVKGIADGRLVDDVAVDPVASPGVQVKDVGAVGAEVSGKTAGVEDVLFLSLTLGVEPGGQRHQGQPCGLLEKQTTVYRTHFIPPER